MASIGIADRLPGGEWFQDFRTLTQDAGGGRCTVRYTVASGNLLQVVGGQIQNLDGVAARDAIARLRTNPGAADLVYVVEDAALANNAFLVYPATNAGAHNLRPTTLFIASTAMLECLVDALTGLGAALFALIAATRNGSVTVTEIIA